VRQSRQRQGSPGGEGVDVDQEAAVVSREDEPPATGGAPVAGCRRSQSLGNGTACRREGCRRCRQGTRAAAAAGAGGAAALRRATAGTRRRSGRGQRRPGGGGAPGRPGPAGCPTTTAVRRAPSLPPSESTLRNCSGITWVSATHHRCITVKLAGIQETGNSMAPDAQCTWRQYVEHLKGTARGTR
jgi:hypothetical protein